LVDKRKKIFSRKESLKNPPWQERPDKKSQVEETRWFPKSNLGVDPQ